MKKQYYLLFSLVGLVLLIPQISQSLSIAITTITADFGSVNTSTGIIGIHGDNFINTNGTGNNVEIGQARIYFVGELHQISYDGKNPQPYLSDQFNLQSQYADQVIHLEPLKGRMFLVSITIIKNVLVQPITIELFINGIDTGKGVTIQPKSNLAFNTVINQDFNNNDNVYWKIITTDSSPNSLLFNAQDLIWYHT